MALSDPFDTTYSGSFKSGLALGEGVGQVAQAYGDNKAKENKLKKTSDMLRQFGILREEEPSYEEYKKAADDYMKQTGSSIQVDTEGKTDEEKIKTLDSIFKAVGIPKPKSGRVTLDANKASELGMEYDTDTGDLKFKPSKNSLSQFGLTGVPEGFEVVGFDQKGQPMVRKEKTETIPASVQNAKNKELKEIKIDTEKNKVTRERVDEAVKALDKIPSGLGGRMAIAGSKMFNPDDPVLGEWQKVKTVLTDATLLNTAYTKGAISDKEMELFKEAAADDNLASKPAVKVVFDKLVRFLDAEEKGKREAFKESYGEDPVGSSESSGVDFSTMSDDELKAIINER